MITLNQRLEELGWTWKDGILCMPITTSRRTNIATVSVSSYASFGDTPGWHNVYVQFINKNRKREQVNLTVSDKDLPKVYMAMQALKRRYNPRLEDEYWNKQIEEGHKAMHESGFFDVPKGEWEDKAE